MELKVAALVVGIVALVLALSGCATSAELPTVLSQPADSTLLQQAQQLRARALVAQFSTGKVKFTGDVIIQMGGTDNVATNAPKAKAPVAAAPGATASEARTDHGTPWYVFAGLVVLGLAGGWLVRSRLRLPV